MLERYGVGNLDPEGLDRLWAGLESMAESDVAQDATYMRLYRDQHGHFEGRYDAENLGDGQASECELPQHQSPDNTGDLSDGINGPGLVEALEDSLREAAAAQIVLRYPVLEGNQKDQRRMLGLPLEPLYTCSHLQHTANNDIPGVHTPYIYYAAERSYTLFHQEDTRLESVNVCWFGSPKIWIIVQPSHAAKLESCLAHLYSHSSHQCSQFVRHLRIMVPPSLLTEYGIRYSIVPQYPGTVIWTLPGAYHYVWNTGPSLAEAVNCCEPDWLPPFRYEYCSRRCETQYPITEAMMEITSISQRQRPGPRHGSSAEPGNASHIGDRSVEQPQDKQSSRANPTSILDSARAGPVLRSSTPLSTGDSSEGPRLEDEETGGSVDLEQLAIILCGSENLAGHAKALKSLKRGQTLPIESLSGDLNLVKVSCELWKRGTVSRQASTLQRRIASWAIALQYQKLMEKRLLQESSRKRGKGPSSRRKKGKGLASEVYDELVREWEQGRPAENREGNSTHIRRTLMTMRSKGATLLEYDKRCGERVPNIWLFFPLSVDATSRARCER